MQTILVIVLLLSPAFSTPVLQLRDDTHLNARTVTINDDGTYTVRIVLVPGTAPTVFTGRGRLKRRGQTVTLEANTPDYRLRVTGDSSNGTGYAVFQLFARGNYEISDRTEDSFRSHDHEQAQHRTRGEPRRTVRTTPRIVPDDTSRFYNPINDCSSFWARDDAPEWVKRQAARDRQTCIDEVRAGKRKR